MRVLLFILLVLVILAVFAYTFVKLALSRLIISVEVPDISGLSLTNFDIAELVKTGSTSLSMKFKTIIVNRNKFKIRMADPFVKIYYQGNLVAQSSKSVGDYKQKVIVGTDSKVTFTETLDIAVNQTSIDVLKMVKNGTRVRLDYEVSLKLWGLGLTYKDNSILNITK